MSELHVVNDRDPKSMFRELLDFIPTGEENAVSMNLLSRLLRTDPRGTRRLIEKARRAGNVIASSDKGYFIPENKEELRRYFNTFNARIRTGYACLRPVRKLLNQAEGGLEYESTLFPE